MKILESFTHTCSHFLFCVLNIKVDVLKNVFVHTIKVSVAQNNNGIKYFMKKTLKYLFLCHTGESLHLELYVGDYIMTGNKNCQNCREKKGRRKAEEINGNVLCGQKRRGT